MSRPAVYNICSETRVARHNLADDYGKFLRVPEAEHFTLHSANNTKDISILVEGAANITQQYKFISMRLRESRLLAA